MLQPGDCTGIDLAGRAAMKTVVIAGALDTKGAGYDFLVRSVRSYGVNALTVDFGVLGDPPFIADVTNAEVARAGGVELSALRQLKDKTLAMRVMADGLSRVLSHLHVEGRLDGVCGMGGFGGPTLLSAGGRGMPVGMPKLLISTVGPRGMYAYVGTAAVTPKHSSVD